MKTISLLPIVWGSHNQRKITMRIFIKIIIADKNNTISHLWVAYTQGMWSSNLRFFATAVRKENFASNEDGAE